MAHLPARARARAHRHFQPFLLRGDIGCPGSSRNFEDRKNSTRPDHCGHLEESLRRYQLFRTLSFPKWIPGSEILPESVQGRAEETLSRPPRTPGEELEIL